MEEEGGDNGASFSLTGVCRSKWWPSGEKAGRSILLLFCFSDKQRVPGTLPRLLQPTRLSNKVCLYLTGMRPDKQLSLSTLYEVEEREAETSSVVSHKERIRVQTIIGV